MSSVILSHNIRRLMVYCTYAKFAYCTTGRFRNLKIFIDSLHFMGHTDDWCRQNCNPDTLPLLQNISFIGLYTCTSVILVIT